MKVVKTLCACLAVLALVPGTALAHHRHHHHGVLLKGTVTSVNASASTLVVKVERANPRGSSLVGHTVTVHAVKGWVADRNNDGRHTIADVKDGDTVVVFTKRRFIDGDAVSAAFVVDKSSFGGFRTASGDRTGDHHCDGDHR